MEQGQVNIVKIKYYFLKAMNIYNAGYAYLILSIVDLTVPDNSDWLWEALNLRCLWWESRGYQVYLRTIIIIILLLCIIIVLQLETTFSSFIIFNVKTIDQ